MYLVLAAFMLGACSSDPKDDPTPTPEPPEYATTLTVVSAPDSVKVETSATLKFTVEQENHPEDFEVKVDMVMPSYYQYLSVVTTSNGYEYSYMNQMIGEVDITINGKEIKDFTSIQAGKENTLYFSNPTAVGEYKIILYITDKYDRLEKKEIILKAWAPEITVKFYTKNIGFDEDTYFEDLNRKYSYSPLSEELKGLRCDTIYTQEEFKRVVLPDGSIGYDSVTTTIPGQCLMCYIGQEGGEDFQVLQAGNGLTLNNYKYASTTTWESRFDGKDGNFAPRKGFHGIMFETSTLTDVGSQLYTIRIVDKWGQEKLATIVYKAFGIDETIPEYCTQSDEIKFWWSHRIPD